MMLTALADVARAAGLKVVEVDGWKTRGHGPQVGVQTITCHHTANGGAAGNAPSLQTVIHGRSDLPGPLSHYVLAKDGTVYVVAAGKCYHAGVSSQTRFTNEYAIGIEAEADGVPGHPGDWPAVQMDAYHRLCRALQLHYGLSVDDVRGHKETCSPAGRKSDPDFDMPSFRAAVANTNLTTNSTPPEDDMKWTDQVKLTDVDARIWGGDYKAGDEVSFGLMVRYPTLARKLDSEFTDFAKAQAKANAAIVAKLDALVAAVGAITAASPAGITEAFKTGIQNFDEAVKNIDVTFTTSNDPTA